MVSCPLRGNRLTTVLVIPDCHCPAQHRDAWAFLAAVKAKYRPGRVVHLGDEVDAHAISMHDHDPDLPSAGDELEAAIDALQPLYKLFPHVEICESNHTSLPYRRAFKFGLPRGYLRTYAEMLRAPKGWHWRESVEVDGVLHIHGEGFSGREGAIKAATAYMQSLWLGHLHAHAGVLFFANAKHLVFGGNAGCLIDRHHPSMKYAAKIAAKPVLGCGITTNGIPTFVPMLLNRAGRWTGELL